MLKSILTLYWTLAISVETNSVIVRRSRVFDVDLTEYRSCLTKFYESQPVWSWLIMHEEDETQPFDYLLKAIYETRVPLYNYDATTRNGYRCLWFEQHVDISTMSQESKVFIMSKYNLHTSLISYGNKSFRKGDKILFSNYNRGKRIDISNVLSYFGVKTTSEGLTRYNLLPIVSFLYVNTTGKVDPVAYIPTNRSDIYKVEKLQLSCTKLFSNSIDKLIFQNDFFTIAVFETVHALRNGDDFFGRDAIIVKILAASTRFPHVFISASDGDTYGDERSYSGVYKEIVTGKAQMALNSRFFLTKIMTDNVVEYTYPFNRDDLVILIPVKLTTAELFYFSYYSYGISIVIIVGLFLYFKLINTRKSLVEVVMIFLLVCSGKSISETDVRKFRVVYMSMMVLAFYGYTLFNIQILSALALQPSEMTVKTVNEFAKTDYKIYAGTTIKTVLSESLENDALAPRILPRIETPERENETKNLEEALLKNCSKNAVICTRSTALYYMDLTNVQGKGFCYNIVPEAIMPSLVTYILGFRSPFQDKFNDLLAQIIESGLVANYTNSPVRKTVTLSDEVKPFGMKTYREKMAWIVYLFGITVAVCTFILELFVFPYLFPILKI